MYVDKKSNVNIAFGQASHPWISQIPELAYSLNGELLVTPPSADPVKVYQQQNQYFYHQLNALNDLSMQLPAMGLQQEQTATQQQLLAYLAQQKTHFLGYQIVVNTDYSDVFPAMNTMVNNLGDPFTNGFFTLNSKAAERAVLDFYASVWRADWPSQRSGHPESYWGYVMSMGSTEGNLYAILNARDYLSGYRLVVDQHDHHLVKSTKRKSNPNYYTPIAFFSDDTHYSISKAIHAMNVASFYDVGSELYPHECPLGGPWPRHVPSEQPVELGTGQLGSGRIDIDKLTLLVEFFAKKEHPILIVLNYGTTFKGAYDDIPGVYKALKDIFIRYGLVNREVCFGDNSGDVDIRQGYWIHVDGALGASFMPFINMAMKSGALNQDNFAEYGAKFPEFDFNLPYISSIVTSGHKFLGAPTPCGIYMSKQKYLATMNNPDYTGAADSTLAGSRNGLAALTLWSLLGKAGYAQLQSRAVKSLTMAIALHQKMTELAQMIRQRDGIDIWLHRSQFSLCLVFRRTNAAISFKYSLCEAQEQVMVGSERVNRHYVHLYCLWDRQSSTLEAFLHDISQPEAFDLQAEKGVKQSD